MGLLLLSVKLIPFHPLLRRADNLRERYLITRRGKITWHWDSEVEGRKVKCTSLEIV